jgi:hypothetical protein
MRRCTIAAPIRPVPASPICMMLSPFDPTEL